jgi:hypothetical protein
MNGERALYDFVRTDPRDVGCAQAMEMLPSTPTWWPRAPRRRGNTPASAHLRPCGPCGEEIEGLLAAVRGDAD